MQFLEKKKIGNFYCKNGSFMVGTKIKKCRKSWKFWPFKKKKARIEILVFFGQLGTKIALN